MTSSINSTGNGVSANPGVIMLNLVLGAALLYSVTVAAIFLLQRDFMYFPDQSQIDPAQTVAPQMKAVSYKTLDGLELTSWYFPPRDETFPVIVHFHGNAGNIASRAGRAKMFIDQGYGVLLAEYRGYGTNPGTPDEPGLMLDGKAAMEFLASQNISSTNVVAYGESLGSGVAVSLAMDLAFEGRALKALILEAPFSSAMDVGQEHYPFFPVKILLKDKFESVPRISAIRAPLLIIHGKEDNIVPYRFGKKLYSAALMPKEAKWLTGAGHNNLYEFGAEEIVMDFLKRQNP